MPAMTLLTMPHHIVLIIFLLISLSGCWKKEEVKKEAPPPGVLVSIIGNKDIKDIVDFIGRTTAINDVSIQAQVNGYLLGVQFEEGADVEKDTELFVIDPDIYNANIAAASGNVAKAKADLARAAKDLVRYKALLREKNISQQQVDITASEVLQTKAQVKYAEAELQKANLDLSYTHIKAPISGRIGRALVSVGNIIGPQTTSLARIVELDPIYVNFNIAESDFIAVKSRHQGKNKSQNNEDNFGVDKEDEGAGKVEVRLILPNKTEYDKVGYIDFIDNAVDPKTGTILVRAKFSNPDKLLVPGMYVRTELSKNITRSELLVHASAVQEDQAGRFVMVVDHENKVEMRRIKTGRQYGGDLIVHEGLQPDEKVVVEGIQKIRPGMIVAPKVAELPGREAAQKGS